MESSFDSIPVAGLFVAFIAPLVLITVGNTFVVWPAIQSFRFLMSGTWIFLSITKAAIATAGTVAWFLWLDGDSRSLVDIPDSDWLRSGIIATFSTWTLRLAGERLGNAIPGILNPGNSGELAHFMRGLSTFLLSLEKFESIFRSREAEASRLRISEKIKKRKENIGDKLADDLTREQLHQEIRVADDMAPEMLGPPGDGQTRDEMVSSKIREIETVRSANSDVGNRTQRRLLGRFIARIDTELATRVHSQNCTRSICKRLLHRH